MGVIGVDRTFIVAFPHSYPPIPLSFRHSEMKFSFNTTPKSTHSLLGGDVNRRSPRNPRSYIHASAQAGESMHLKSDTVVVQIDYCVVIFLFVDTTLTPYSFALRFTQLRKQALWHSPWDQSYLCGYYFSQMMVKRATPCLTCPILKSR